jgi:TetR/AcrR family hemagglutinin/protease transcriptional regulator
MSPTARREQLMQAALALCARRGLGSARHSDLAEAAGVAVPTTFHYFPTKTDLVNAVIGEVHRFLLEDIVAPHTASNAPAPVIIERTLTTFCDAIDSHPDHIRVWLEWSVSVREGLWESYLGFYRASLEAIGHLIARGQERGEIRVDLDVDDAARVIVGLAHMIVQMKFSGSSREQVAHTVHSLVQGYLRAPGGGA